MLVQDFIGRPDFRLFFHPCLPSFGLVAVGINNQLKSGRPTWLVLYYLQVALEKRSFSLSTFSDRLISLETWPIHDPSLSSE